MEERPVKADKGSKLAHAVSAVYAPACMMGSRVEKNIADRSVS